MPPPSTFYRDPALPFIEARRVDDGSRFAHAPHSHDTFSIGVVTAGYSDYLNLSQRQVVGPGSVVLMNPGAMHACNPLANQPWAYRMLYFDTQWLQAAQGSAQWRPFSQVHSDAPWLAQAVLRAFGALAQAGQEPLAREEALVQFAQLLQQRLQGAAAARGNSTDQQLARVVEYIDAYSHEHLTLDGLAAQVGLSGSQLIRRFRQRYGFSPYEYVVNRRVQVARAHLRQGQGIADAALQAGFADQAHLQRAFKRHLAATPGHYRASTR